MSVNPVPQGYHSVTPYLIVAGAADAIRFYEQAFGATELYRMPMGDRIGHAEIKIGDSFVMLADEYPEMGHLGPSSRGGPTCSLMIYLEDVDSAFDRAIKAGATEARAVQNQFYGDRSGTLTDPFGHQWTLATHVEDVAPEEMQRRMDAMSKQADAGLTESKRPARRSAPAFQMAAAKPLRRGSSGSACRALRSVPYCHCR